MSELTATVEAIGEMHFEGNIVPHTWYQHPLLKTKAGKLHKCAMDLLADILYWYRPVVVRDETTGRILERRRRFEADRWRIDYAQWAKLRGYSKRQVQEAANFLKHQGIIYLEVCDYETSSGYKIHNAVFLEPIPAMIHELNQIEHEKGHIPKKRDNPHEKTGYTKKTGSMSPEKVAHTPKKREPRTESTTESTSKTSTTDADDSKISLSNDERATLYQFLIEMRLDHDTATYLLGAFPEQCRKAPAWWAGVDKSKIRSTQKSVRSFIEHPEKWPATTNSPTEPPRPKLDAAAVEKLAEKFALDFYNELSVQEKSMIDKEVQTGKALVDMPQFAQRARTSARNVLSRKV